MLIFLMLHSGSDVARKWLGCGSGVVRLFFCCSDVARMWLGSGSDVARLFFVVRKWLGRGSEVARKRLVCGSGAALVNLRGFSYNSRKSGALCKNVQDFGKLFLEIFAGKNILLLLKYLGLK